MQESAQLERSDTMVLDYLAALWAASDDLDPGLRDELMTTVADYVAMRRTAVAPRDDPTALLHALGRPEDLVAAARRGHIPVHLRRPRRLGAVPAPSPMEPGSSLDAAGVALLGAGSFLLPGAATLAGLAMVTGSPRWGAVPKISAWLLGALPVALSALLLLIALVVGHVQHLILLAYLATAAGAFTAAIVLLATRRR